LLALGKSVSLIMLVYNEAEIIEEVIRDYYNKVASKLDDMEFIVAEDGSTDGTKEILDNLAKDLPITLHSGNERKGYVRAYRDALSLPQKEVVFFSDSSGKHDPADFWKMYELTDRYDIVSGYKKHRKDPFYRILLTKGFNAIVNLYFGIHLRDIDSGFKIMTLQAVRDVMRDQWIVTDLISFEIVVRLLKKGYTLIEIPVSHSPRKNGPSRGLPAKKIPKVIWRIMRNFPKIKRAIT
jgi:glycosyltransferase involved in cell wall biosynthesis